MPHTLKAVTSTWTARQNEPVGPAPAGFLYARSATKQMFRHPLASSAASQRSFSQRPHAALSCDPKHGNLRNPLLPVVLAVRRCTRPAENRRQLSCRSFMLNQPRSTSCVALWTISRTPDRLQQPLHPCPAPRPLHVQRIHQWPLLVRLFLLHVHHLDPASTGKLSSEKAELASKNSEIRRPSWICHRSHRMP